jgi:hypothetical protein
MWSDFERKGRKNNRNMQIYLQFFVQNLHMSEKSSNFAAANEELLFALSKITKRIE